MLATANSNAAAKMTAIEKKDLAQQEQIIRDGFLGFVAIGQALSTIHTKNYYQAVGSWKKYLKVTFGLGAGRAHRIVNASKMYLLLQKEGCDYLPSNEHVAATMHDKWGGEKPERIVEVWQLCCDRKGDAKHVTGGLIQDVTRELNGDDPIERRDRHVMEVEAIRKTLDEIGNRSAKEPLPEDLLQMLESLKKKLSATVRKIKVQQEKRTAAA